MALERRLKILDSGTEAEWIKAAIRVAFASTDMRQVNQHFGAAESTGATGTRLCIEAMTSAPYFSWATLITLLPTKPVPPVINTFMVLSPLIVKR